MGIPPGEVDKRIESMTKALRDERLRLTHQRLEIIREIARTDEHPGVERVYARVRSRVPTISLDTVYRTLGTLARHGLVDRVAVTVGPVRYDANVARHHHFVCERCGKVRDVVDPVLDAVRAPRSALTIGAVESVDVQLRGVCKECARQGERQ